jgi:hypothetical protein
MKSNVQSFNCKTYTLDALGRPSTATTVCRQIRKSRYRRCDSRRMRRKKTRQRSYCAFRRHRASLRVKKRPMTHKCVRYREFSMEKMHVALDGYRKISCGMPPWTLVVRRAKRQSCCARRTTRQLRRRSCWGSAPGSATRTNSAACELAIVSLRRQAARHKGKT